MCVVQPQNDVIMKKLYQIRNQRPKSHQKIEYASKKSKVVKLWNTLVYSSRVQRQTLLPSELLITYLGNFFTFFIALSEYRR